VSRPEENIVFNARLERMTPLLDGPWNAREQGRAARTASPEGVEMSEQAELRPEDVEPLHGAEAALLDGLHTDTVQPVAWSSHTAPHAPNKDEMPEQPGQPDKPGQPTPVAAGSSRRKKSKAVKAKKSMLSFGDELDEMEVQGGDGWRKMAGAWLIVSTTYPVCSRVGMPTHVRLGAWLSGLYSLSSRSHYGGISPAATDSSILLLLLSALFILPREYTRPSPVARTREP
jgi:hypothetical protein